MLRFLVNSLFERIVIKMEGVREGLFDTTNMSDHVGFLESCNYMENRKSMGSKECKLWFEEELTGTCGHKNINRNLKDNELKTDNYRGYDCNEDSQLKVWNMLEIEMLDTGMEKSWIWFESNEKELCRCFEDGSGRTGGRQLV